MDLSSKAESTEEALASASVASLSDTGATTTTLTTASSTAALIFPSAGMDSASTKRESAAFDSEQPSKKLKMAAAVEVYDGAGDSTGKKVGEENENEVNSTNAVLAASSNRGGVEEDNLLKVAAIMKESINEKLNARNEKVEQALEKKLQLNAYIKDESSLSKTKVFTSSLKNGREVNSKGMELIRPAWWVINEIDLSVDAFRRERSINLKEELDRPCWFPIDKMKTLEFELGGDEMWNISEAMRTFSFLCSANARVKIKRNRLEENTYLIRMNGGDHQQHRFMCLLDVRPVNSEDKEEIDELNNILVRRDLDELLTWRDGQLKEFRILTFFFKMKYFKGTMDLLQEN